MRPIDADVLVSDIESARNMFFHSPYERRFHEDRIEFALNMVEDVPTIDYVPRQQWISVKDRLPDIDAEVLIRTDEGLYDVAQYSGGDRFWTLERNPDCWVTVSGVTHWMPLPEPPKEEEE